MLRHKNGRGCWKHLLIESACPGQRRREKIKTLEKKVQDTVSKLPTPPPTVSPPVIAYEHPEESDITFLTSNTPWTSLPDEDAGGLFQVRQYDEQFTDDTTHALIMDFLSIPSEQTENQELQIKTSKTNLPDCQNSLMSSTQGVVDTTTYMPLEEELQTLETSQFTFSDDFHLEVPELKSMQAGMQIAALLGCATSIWDPTALRTFNLSSLPDPTLTIPSNLAPTDAQRLIPHHPLLDMFPWPSMRTRLICVFAQPVHLRPVIAREPDALVKLGMDMEDGVEGIRVSGEAWYDGDSWEVGEVMYKNWWWCLDRKIVENSNRLRRLRGAPKLVICGQGMG